MGICSSSPVPDYASVTSPDEAENRPRRDSQAPGALAAEPHKSTDGQSTQQQSNNAKLVLGRSDDIRSLYTFDKVLGKGQFGVTRLVVDNKTAERYACKTISKRKLVNTEDIEDVRREIKVMHHLSGHPNVVTFIGAYEDAYNIHIVMELCTGT
jgi:calcium-dependent protein kinase